MKLSKGFSALRNAPISVRIGVVLVVAALLPPVAPYSAAIVGAIVDAHSVEQKEGDK